MPQDNGKKYTLDSRTYNKLVEIFNQKYVLGYSLSILNSEERKRLFNAFYICAVRAITNGALEESFVKALFETVSEIVHGAPEYRIDKKDRLNNKEAGIMASGYKQQMSAVIKFYYDKKKGRNVISSIWINQRGLL